MRIDKSELEIELKDRQRKIDSHQKTMRNVEEEYRKLSELFLKFRLEKYSARIS